MSTVLVHPLFLWGLIVGGVLVQVLIGRHAAARVAAADERIAKATEGIERAARIAADAARDFHAIAKAYGEFNEWREGVDRDLTALKNAAWPAPHGAPGPVAPLALLPSGGGSDAPG